MLVMGEQMLVMGEQERAVQKKRVSEFHSIASSFVEFHSIASMVCR